MEQPTLKSSLDRLAWSQYEEDGWKGSGLIDTHYHRQPLGRVPLRKFYYGKPERE